MSAIFKRGNATVQGNLTPMIDMVFLLIVFFVLVSRIVDREAVDMNLPQPKEALSERMGDEQRIVINVLPGPGGLALGYRLGGTNFSADQQGVSALALQLESSYRINPSIGVNVRADRATQYEHVEPVLHAVSLAARSAGQVQSMARVNLVVVQEDQR